MYGIFINAIKAYAIHNEGQQVWQQVCASAGLEDDFFINSEFYPDPLLENILKALVYYSGKTTADLYYHIGYWWALHSVPKLYLGKLEKGVPAYRQFLLDFPLFINRLSLIYEKLTLTQFRSVNVSEAAIDFFHTPYRLKEPRFSEGVLHGFAALFAVPDEAFSVQQLETEGASFHFRVVFL
ncbi:heme NO-binding domain-containing protein [Flavobacterium sp.]|jgi:hypothetical protein|uniref:heme NO-binding domain-containing protein n=1 Tax=Flavobacterium sp. TaxID=239 RepID=UPI0022C442AD|nr:heme NO-binding domain-containing protein [Flavobacterium sp.]MCZ8145143.1 heme NO-binding domain-containing protein [Flavobacterium sp.]MCZ8368238.1 heme NO-binding domain-containing protein [Flavobacterium sp.]